MWSGHGSGHRLRRCSVPAYLLRGERNGARQRVGTIGKRAGAARLTISLSSTAAANYAEYAAEISSGLLAELDNHSARKARKAASTSSSFTMPLRSALSSACSSSCDG